MTDQPYFPASGNAWDKIDPQQAGYAPDKLAAAVGFAQDNETPWPRGFYYDDGRYAPNVDWNETGPWSAVLGPVKERGGPRAWCCKAATCWRRGATSRARI
ncbi:hypothetical protein [Tardiphaga alba]|uniref:hypothetical protein n=1 Tax=Tardiphaga alba TaxID=340268 RepID=UPI0020121E47|nr:hypothetical protein [Tardiphaga alba]